MLERMSERLVFDTHRFVRDMVAVGMAEPIAERLAEKQLEMLRGDLATQVELAQVEANLRIELAAINERITQVEANLKTELAATNERITQVEANLKTDITQVEANLKTDITQVEANLKTELAATKTSLVKWMVTIMTAYTAAIAALARALAG